MSFLPNQMMGIAELAGQAGVTLRTIRYYVAEGLLPPPTGVGPNRVYTEEHLHRLRAIRHLKSAFLPLSEIRRRLGAMSSEELERLADQPEPSSTSAFDYLASVLPGTTASSTSVLPAMASPDREPASKQRRPRSTTSSPAAESVWHRVVLAPGVELHYQRSGDHRRDQAISHVIKRAVSFFDVVASRDDGGKSS